MKDQANFQTTEAPTHGQGPVSVASAFKRKSVEAPAEAPQGCGQASCVRGKVGQVIRVIGKRSRERDVSEGLWSEINNPEQSPPRGYGLSSRPFGLSLFPMALERQYWRAIGCHRAVHSGPSALFSARSLKLITFIKAKRVRLMFYFLTYLHLRVLCSTRNYSCNGLLIQGPKLLQDHQRCDQFLIPLQG